MPRSLCALIESQRCDRHRVWIRVAVLATCAPLLAVFAGCGTLHRIKVASHHWFGHGHATGVQVCAEALEPVCHGYEQTTWRPMHDCEPVTAYTVMDELPMEADMVPHDEAAWPADVAPEEEDFGVATPLPPGEPVEQAVPPVPDENSRIPAVDDPSRTAPEPSTSWLDDDPSSVVVPSTPRSEGEPVNRTPNLPVVPAAPAIPSADPADTPPHSQTRGLEPADPFVTEPRLTLADERSDFFRARNRSYALQPTTVSSTTAAFALFNELARALPLSEPEVKNDLDVPTPAEDHSLPMAKFINVD